MARAWLDPIWADMSHYFQHSSICQTLTADTTAPEFSDKVAMTFSRWWLKNVGNKRLVKWIPSVAAGWCLLIDGLIPWRNRMCRGRRLMEQTESCIPQTASLSASRALPSSDGLSLSFALHRLPPPAGLKGQTHIRFVFIFFKMQHYVLLAPDLMWKRKIRHFSWWEM